MRKDESCYYFVIFTGAQDMYRTFDVLKVLNTRLEFEGFKKFIDHYSKYTNYTQFIIIDDTEQKIVGVTAFADIAAMNQRELKVANIAVLDEYKRRQIGEMMVRCVMYYAKKHGYDKVHFTTAVKNQASNALNRKLRFSDDGIDHYRLVFSETTDLFFEKAKSTLPSIYAIENCHHASKMYLNYPLFKLLDRSITKAQYRTLIDYLVRTTHYAQFIIYVNSTKKPIALIGFADNPLLKVAPKLAIKIAHIVCRKHYANEKLEDLLMEYVLRYVWQRGYDAVDYIVNDRDFKKRALMHKFGFEHGHTVHYRYELGFFNSMPSDNVALDPDSRKTRMAKL